MCATLRPKPSAICCVTPHLMPAATVAVAVAVAARQQPQQASAPMVVPQWIWMQLQNLCHMSITTLRMPRL
jgi:hypothetical protein